MSGGTNEKTSELAKMCCLRYKGIGIGSYARKIVRNKNLDDAIIEAKKLIESCKMINKVKNFLKNMNF